MELERYELREGPAYDFEVDRREFLQRIGGGLLIVALVGTADAQESGRGGRRGGRSMPKEIGAWLHVGEDGAVTVFTGKAEVGQNIRTSLAQAVAEELRVPLASVHMVMADTDLTPFDMGTFGSLTTPQMAPQLRKAAAAARTLLVKLAAAKWNEDSSKLTAHDGFVSDANGHRASYGELSKGEKLLETIEADVALTPATDWHIAGTSAPKINGRDFVTGRHQYASDIVRPSMLFGQVVRPESFGATLVRLESGKVPKGVTVVHEGDFAGVVAPTPEEADRAASAIHVEWKSKPQPSSQELFAYLRANADAPRTVHEAGSVPDALANAPVKLKQTYQIAYIAHTPLEPRAAVAEWSGDRLPFGLGHKRLSAFGANWPKPFTCRRSAFA